MIMTPVVLAQSIVDSFAPRGRLLDPCRGSGAFHNALRRHSETVDWCELSEGRDFLRYNEPADWIISNPPWSKFRAFLTHAMEIADNIVWLVTLPHLTRARLDDMDAAGFGIARMIRFPNPPPPWPGGGFQLIAAHFSRGATSML